MAKMWKRLRNTVSGETGASTIPIVILAIILCIMISAMTQNFININYIRQIESVLDLASVEALRINVNEEKFRQGTLQIDDAAKTVRDFKTIVNDSLDGLPSTISYNYSVEPYIVKDSSGLATSEGSSGQSYFLQALVTIDCYCNPMFDNFTGETLYYYNILDGSSDVVVSTVPNVAGDKKMTIQIQSIGKITLR